MRPRHLAVVSAFVLSALPVCGQELRASIEGTVKDATGAVLTRATVEARGAAGGAVSTATDASGHYRFASLRPGLYELTVRREGLSSSTTDVDLALGQNLRVDVGLSLPGATETVIIRAEAPVLDVTQSSRFVNIRGDRISKLPRGRDYTSLITQAPGVNPAGLPEYRGIMVDGSSGSENRYIVDGVDTTHLGQGNAAVGVVTEAVEEVQVKSSGYSAEHGGATGGVINLITRSGSNRWSGEAGVHYTSDWLQGEARPFLLFDPNTGEPYHERFPKDSLDRWEPALSLGGPLRRDVAWFFLNLSPVFARTERTLTFHPSEQLKTFTNEFRGYNANANVSAQLSSRVSGRLAVNASPTTSDGDFPFYAGFGNPLANYDIKTTRPTHSFSGNVDYVASSRLFLSARGGYWFSNTRQEGAFQGHQYVFNRSNIGMAGVPADLQKGQGFSNTNNNLDVTRNVFKRLSGQADGTLYVSGAGRHAVKAGVQIERLRNDIVGGQTGSLVRLFWGDAFLGQRGPFGYYFMTSNGVLPGRGVVTEGDVRSHNLAVFIQDAWTIGQRLTVNFGVRAEKENVPSYTSAYGIGPTAFEFGFGDKLAPRAGAAWDVNGDGKWKVYGSWGLFYDQMKYTLARERLGGVKSLLYWYTLDTPDWPNLIQPGCPPACPGTLIQGPIDTARPRNIPGESAIDPDLEPTRLQEAVLGAEHQLTSTISVGARYVHKQIDQALDDIGTLDEAGNDVYTIGNPGYGRAAQTGFGPAMPRAVRDYDALELTVDKRMTNRWALHASYLLSRLYGNYSGLSDGIEGQPATNLNPSFNDPIRMFGTDGRPLLGVLETDRTHQLKAHVTRDFRFGSSLGASMKVLSGTPLTRTAPFVAGRSYYVAYAGFASDGRLPTLSQLDLYLQHEVRVSGEKRVQLGVNIVNVFDQDVPVLRAMNELEEAVDIDPHTYLRGFDPHALIASQAPRRDRFFMKDYGFQEPREIRLSVKLIF